MRLRASCVPCTVARRRCDAVAGRPACQRCERNGTADDCVFEPARKRGPRGPRARRAVDRPGDPLSAPLPDPELLNLAMNRYIRTLYMGLPVAVRCEVCTELARGTLPDFMAYSLVFWTFWFDTELAGRCGAQYPAVLRQLFRRIDTAIRAAVELVLVGCPDEGDEGPGRYAPDWAMNASGKKRKEYRSLATSVLVALLHLINVAMAFKDPTSEPYSDVRQLLQLAVGVAKTAGINTPRFFRNPGGRGCPVSERARRTWWSLAIGDIQLGVMSGVAPLLRQEESMDLEMYMSDPEFDVEKRSVETELCLPLQQPELDSAGASKPIFNVLNSSFHPNGTLSLVHHHVRIFFLLSRAVEHRRAHSRDTLPSIPLKDAIVDDLQRWFKVLPLEIQALDLDGLAPESLVNVPGISASIDPGPAIASDLSQVLATVVYTLLVYHTACIELSGPGIENWTDPTAIPIDWLQTPSFVVCQEHAIRATRLLRGFLKAGYLDFVGKPFFQHCVCRTGVVHLGYWDQLTRISADPRVPLLRDLMEQVDVHTAVLGMGSSVQGGRSHWHKVWEGAVARVSGAAIGGA